MINKLLNLLFIVSGVLLGFNLSNQPTDLNSTVYQNLPLNIEVEKEFGVDYFYHYVKKDSKNNIINEQTGMMNLEGSKASLPKSISSNIINQTKIAETGFCQKIKDLQPILETYSNVRWPTVGFPGIILSLNNQHSFLHEFCDYVN